MNLKNKHILITGASRGIGRATAILMAEQGATIGINYRSNDQEARNTLSELSGDGHELFKEDVSEEGAAQELIESVVSRFGKIDVLVNNAGVAILHDTNDDFESWKRIWHQTLSTNLIAVADLCYWASHVMKQNGGGKIINVSSRGAFRGEPGQPAYGASKAGLNSLSQSLAKALAKDNISVFAVAPGFTETDMGLNSITEDEKEKLIQESPFKRMAKPKEVAQAITHFAQDGSEYSSGAILDVNGASYLRS
tara:strand:- start:13151 stop:13906 length:756 start_codon:yes stop_codon:yes gene_type:complete